MHEFSNGSYDPPPTPGETAFDPEFLTAPNGGIGDTCQEDSILDESQSPDTSVIGIPEERGTTALTEATSSVFTPDSPVEDMDGTGIGTAPELTKDLDDFQEPLITQTDTVSPPQAEDLADSLGPVSDSDPQVAPASNELEPAALPLPPAQTAPSTSEPETSVQPEAVISKPEELVAAPDDTLKPGELPSDTAEPIESPASLEFPAIRLTQESDAADRMPQFEEIKAVVKDLFEQGALEGISEGVKYYLERLVPVGVNEKGEVVRPEGYRPEEMVPVLVVKPREAIENYTLPGLPSEAEAMARIVNKSGIALTAEQFRITSSSLGTFKFPASTKAEGLLFKTSDYAPRSYFVLPRLIIVSGAPTDRMWFTQSIPHEADHWDFFLNKAPTLRNENGTRYSAVELVSIAEKRAYQTGFTLARSLGHYDARSVEKLVETYKQLILPPADADNLARRIFTFLRQKSVPEVSLTPASMTIASQLYGHPDKRITGKEMTAFIAMGILSGEWKNVG